MYLNGTIREDFRANAPYKCGGCISLSQLQIKNDELRNEK